MTQKVHGFVGTPDQFLSGGLNMFEVTVAGADLTVLVGEEEEHNVALDGLVELISTRAQPVVLGTVTATGFRFAVEHNDVFGDLAAFSAYVEAGLQAKLNDTAVTVEIEAFVF